MCNVGGRLLPEKETYNNTKKEDMLKRDGLSKEVKTERTEIKRVVPTGMGSALSRGAQMLTLFTF